MKKIISVSLILLLAACQSSQVPSSGRHDKSAQPAIDHVVVIYLENHSFYNLFAQFPGADNTVQAGYQGQVDGDGKLYKTLPQVSERHSKVGDPRFPKNLKNETFLIDRYVKISDRVPDPNHEFFTHMVQMDGGKNDKFVAYSAVGALPVGYYDMTKTYLWKMAREYTLADNFFQSSIGGSFINHQWLIAARTPQYENAPEKIRTVLNAKGLPVKANILTPDGYAVNTIQPRLMPFDPAEKDDSRRLPVLEYDTIGDRLSSKNISWAWYAGGWNDILNGKNDGDFQFHHQPFLYFKKYGPNTEGRRDHLKDEADLLSSIDNGTLPSVAFFKPVGNENAHPGYSDVSSGDEKVRKVVEKLKASKYWQNTLVIVTFDEHGGFWDPKPAKQLDRWGLGTRIPAVFISPQVKHGFVDHNLYETTSILSYLEKRYDLAPLTERDKNASPLLGIWK
ncbi:MAG TPA: alkaline phosphatase family protein [Bdellovibrio sp.]|uniref:alkaline phosphatase family protein n=1 Tax=Bdellovibrio sp. TaxID=28201 RepID=UPI002F02B14C